MDLVRQELKLSCGMYVYTRLFFYDLISVIPGLLVRGDVAMF